MSQSKMHDFLFKNVSILDGVGSKTIKLLKKKRPIEKKFLKNLNSFNFIDNGHLDSLEIISFNFSIEKKFKIKFNFKELSSKKYKTISGLSDIIFKKIN